MIPFNSRLPSLDELVEEVAVSVNINGINHAVMMATPDDLDDFAIGFLFGEGIIGGNHDVHDIQSTPSEHGIVLDVTIANRCLAMLGQRKRRLAGDTARAATSGDVQDLRREARALKECVADLTLENRLLKKSMIADGGDDE